MLHFVLCLVNVKFLRDFFTQYKEKSCIFAAVFKHIMLCC